MKLTASLALKLGRNPQKERLVFQTCHHFVRGELLGLGPLGDFLCGQMNESFCDGLTFSRFLSKIQRFLHIKGRGGEVWISFFQGARGGYRANRYKWSFLGT